jgi:hypothetical protein
MRMPICARFGLRIAAIVIAAGLTISFGLVSALRAAQDKPPAETKKADEPTKKSKPIREEQEESRWMTRMSMSVIPSRPS